MSCYSKFPLKFCFTLFPKYLASSIRSGCVPKNVTYASTCSRVNVLINILTSIIPIGTSINLPLACNLVRGPCFGQDCVALDSTGGPSYSTSGEVCSKSCKIAKISSRIYRFRAKGLQSDKPPDEQWIMCSAWGKSSLAPIFPLPAYIPVSTPDQTTWFISAYSLNVSAKDWGSSLMPSCQFRRQWHLMQIFPVSTMENCWLLLVNW